MTGIFEQTNLASIASRMGAVHKFDLTSDVTHLIVGDSDTPKYKFVAREREDVKCLLPSWIEAVRLSWMEGEETDVEALEREHTLPTFAGLRICVTGFDDRELQLDHDLQEGPDADCLEWLTVGNWRISSITMVANTEGILPGILHISLPKSLQETSSITQDNGVSRQSQLNG